MTLPRRQSDQFNNWETKRKVRYVRLVNYLLDRRVARRSPRILGDRRNGCLYSQSSIRDIRRLVPCLPGRRSTGDLRNVDEIEVRDDVELVSSNDC